MSSSSSLSSSTSSYSSSSVPALPTSVPPYLPPYLRTSLLPYAPLPPSPHLPLRYIEETQVEVGGMDGDDEDGWLATHDNTLASGGGAGGAVGEICMDLAGNLIVSEGGGRDEGGGR